MWSCICLYQQFVASADLLITVDMELKSTSGFYLFILLLLVHHGQSSLRPHQQRRFLGRELPPLTPAQLDPPPYTVGHVTQLVDHFNASDTRTFSQRYLAYDKFWDKKGPIFVYTGNEGDIVWFFQNTGFVVDDLSQHFKALIIFIEHRYYGESMPFGADSYKDTEHLQYLDSQQALADFAYAVHDIKNSYNTSSPAVAVGGSYGGMLSAWFRMTYPDVVIGSLAASAPLWWFSNLTPCNSAYLTITKDFSEIPLPDNQDCSKIIRSVWDEITAIAKQSDGLATLNKMFRLCTPLKNMDDVEMLMSWLEDTLFNLAMVDYPYTASFLEPLPPWPINVTCHVIYGRLLKSKNVVDAVAAGVGVYYNSSGQAGSCFNTSQTATSSLGTQGWDYQACSEMIMPMCSNGVTDMFREHKWNLTEYEKGCIATYPGVVPQPDLVLKLYGGKNITKDSNIIFSNGLLDPWSGGGVLHDISKSLRAIVLEKGAHHLDLRASQPNDPPELTKARDLEMAIITGWINDYRRL